MVHAKKELLNFCKLYLCADGSSLIAKQTNNTSRMSTVGPSTRNSAKLRDGASILLDVTSVIVSKALQPPCTRKSTDTCGCGLLSSRHMYPSRNVIRMYSCSCSFRNWRALINLVDR